MRNRTVIGSFALVLIVTAIVVAPERLYAQREDEARAIADIFQVLEGEQAYAKRNCGYFAPLANLCRAGEGECTGIGIPGYRLDEPGFLSTRLGVRGPLLESGYVRTFIPGARPPQPSTSCDSESVMDFCYDLTPSTNSRGLPAFLGTGWREVFIDRTGSELACPIPPGTEKFVFPSILSPPPGSTLSGPDIIVEWVPGDAPVDEWRLTVGPSAWAGESFDSGILPGTSHSTLLSKLPTDGREIVLRLWYRLADVWAHSDFDYRASSMLRPSILFPKPDSKLTSSVVHFVWSANGLPVDTWWFLLGSSPGSYEYALTSLPGTSVSYTALYLPEDGRPLYARLWYLSRGIWRASDFFYTAVGQGWPASPRRAEPR